MKIDLWYNKAIEIARVAGFQSPLALQLIGAKAMFDYITIPLSKYGKNRGKYETIVSVEDAEIAQSNWAVIKARHTQYVIQKDETGKTTYLHRVILARKLERDELLPHEQVDHINRNGLDNRRENLRLVTPSENQHNKGKYKNNTSGYKGVFKSGKRWGARIKINRKYIYLGYFDTPELAYETYCEATKKYHGEFRNLLNEGY